MENRMKIDQRNSAKAMLAAACGVLLPGLLLAQTASDGCSYGGGSQYTVNSSCTFQDFDKPGSFGNDLNPSGCSGSSNDDAFGWFTATSTSTTITYDPDNAGHDPIMHLFSGACGSLTNLTCANTSAGGGNETITWATTIGTNYLVRIQRNGSNNGMDGRLCVYSTPPPPANDDPCGAVALTVNQICSNTAATNISATATGGGIPAPGCAGYSSGDVWFTFVAPANGIANIETTAGSLTDSGIALYSATACNGTFTLIECDDNDGPSTMSLINRTGLTPGQTYYVRVWGNGGAQGTFNICVTTAPANDEPCGATSLSLGSSCTFTTYNSTNATTSAGISPPGCSTYSGGDVWFSFVAPASGAVTIRTGAQSITNLAMALYSASSCSGTLTIMECDDNDGPGNMPFLTFSSVDLVVGETYYLRVWQSGSSSGGTFDLCAMTVPSGGDCTYALRMFDTGGDGWGGSTVTVQVGAGAPVNYTLSTGNQEVVYIAVAIGQLVQISYTAMGGFQNEISYFMQLEAGIIYQDGPTPGTGLRYANFANCVPPSPPNSDCSGGSMICDDAGFNASPSHTGVKADLNVTNRGCLSTDERQGTWYNFTPSASGTVEMTIAPTNAGDDYDFAIWGPMSSLACPPTVTPYRCSYSGATGNTGLQIGAGDDTEGAGGDKWVNAMSVTAGEVYVLYISNYTRSGLAFNLTWTLTGGASLDCFLLPVELLGLEAIPNAATVNLEWATASEQNSAFFAVERSHNGTEFEQIGVVSAAGFSSTAVHYEFQDDQPVMGMNYYRLKQVDADGASSLSNVVVATFRGKAGVGMPYPNPAGNEVNLDIKLDNDDDVQLIIHDASGRMVHTERMGVAAGTARVRAPLHGLEAGSYELTIVLSSGERIHAGRFMIN